MSGIKMEDKKNEDVARDLVSFVVAHVRKGLPRTNGIPRPSRNHSGKKLGKRLVDEVPVSDNSNYQTPPSPEEITEQLRKFENMMIIQRLDKLVDMQRMQWEILNRLTSLLETMTATFPVQDELSGLESTSSSTEELEELIKAQESNHQTKTKSVSSTEAELQYEQAETYARRLSKIKNEVN